MTMKVQALCFAALLAIIMATAGCGHYVCGTTFGSSSCAASPTGVSTGGGGGSGGGGAATAFAFAGLASSTGIQSFTFSASGKSFVATPNATTTTAPTFGGGELIVVQGKFLYGTFPGTGLYSQIYGWTIDSSGGLTAISGSPFTVANWTGTILGSLATNPSGTLLFRTDPGAVQGSSTVRVFQVGTQGALTEASGSPTALPFSPGMMAMDGLGKYLYVLALPSGLSGAEIGAYSVSSSGGLVAVQGGPFSYPMAQVAGDASGKYLIGTTGGTNGTDAHLYVFSIQQSGTNAGAIAPVAGSPFATLYSPFEIAVQPKGGELLYSFSLNQTTTNPIEGYQLNISTGALTKVTGSPFTAFTGEDGVFDQSGAYLFGQDGNTITAYQVSSDGTLTSFASILEGWGTQIAITDVP